MNGLDDSAVLGLRRGILVDESPFRMPGRMGLNSFRLANALAQYSTNIVLISSHSSGNFNCCIGGSGCESAR